MILFKNASFFRAVIGATAASLFMHAASGHAQSAAELHRLFEERCGRCHAHAGDLVHEKLSLVNGVLRSRAKGRDIRGFLRRHHAPADPALAEALYSMLARVAGGQGRFKEQCAICHVRASKLAKNKLIIADGQLRGRYTSNDIRKFLAGHGRLDADGATFFYDLFLWQARP
jgi:mono/diheme cytochrome c family protein